MSLKKVLLPVALLGLAVGAQAAAPDATDILDAATLAFESVGALIVSMVGFFIIVRIVKKVRG